MRKRRMKISHIYGEDAMIILYQLFIGANSTRILVYDTIVLYLARLDNFFICFPNWWYKRKEDEKVSWKM